MSDVKIIIKAWILTSLLNACVLYVPASCSRQVKPPVTISTKSGVIRGKYESIDGCDVASFLGIPFAEPPIGQRRFQKPEPVKYRQGIINATKFSNSCIQFSDPAIPWSVPGQDSEDCLYLNIWVPGICSRTNEFPVARFPVMVWIHGGAFVLGSSSKSLYHGAVVSSYGDVILVTINYRLGVFGFLDIGVSDAPANVALYDQALALTWVKHNIAYFGGDSNNIVLFGESAGAVSTGLHILSPISKGLFNRAIIQSGGIYMPAFALNQTTQRNINLKFATAAGCENETENLLTNPRGIVQCLRRKRVQELLKAQISVQKSGALYFPFPTFGNEFLPMSPNKILQEGKFEGVPVIIGTNKNEGSIFPLLFLPDSFDGQDVKDFSLGKAKFIIGLLLLNTGIPLNDVFEFYFSNIQEGDHEAVIEAFSNCFGDFAIICPSVFTAEAMQGNARYYVFTHRPSNAIVGPWGGVTHFEEIQFVFGLPIRDRVNYTYDERVLSEDIIRKWTNFAKTGYPLDPSSDEKWPIYTKQNAIYRELNENNKNLQRGPRIEACNFWRKYYNI